MMKLLIPIFLIFTVALKAQIQDWVQRYNGPGNGLDVAESIAVDDSGNVYVTGQSTGINNNLDCATIKYNSEGNEIWVQSYNAPGNGDDKGMAIAVDKFGNIYVTGEAEVSGGNRDFLTIKYNSSGIQQWVNAYNGPGNNTDVATLIVVDDSCNVYVSGYSWGSGTLTDYALIKYDSAGAQKWVKRYNGPGNLNDVPRSIAVDDSGNIYVTGESVGAGTNYDFATIKYDPAGNEKWIRRYHNNGVSNEKAASLFVDGQGNVYVTGSSDGDGTSDYVTIKYNHTGTQQWLKKYDGPASNADIPSSMSGDGAGNVFVTGLSMDTLGGQLNADYATIKYSATGIEQWVRRYNGPADSSDYPYSIAPDSAGNIYVTGRSIGDGTAADYATISYTSAGEEQWVQRYNGPGNGNDEPWNFTVDPWGNAYVTGGSMGSTSGFDFATVKCSSLTTEMGKDPHIVARHFQLKQNYPNPFNPTTIIQYAISGQQFVSLKIYDILGKEIAALVNEEKSAGEYAVEFNGSDLSSGIYLYRFRAGENFAQTKKMILMR